MAEEMKKTYIGVKKVEAYPEDRDGKPGYAVIYPYGYKSWSPKEVFEAAYLPVERPDDLDQDDIINMIDSSEIDISTVGDKTTMVRVTLPTGFVMVDASAYIDPENYCKTIGAAICIGNIKRRLWEMLSFTFQWAHHGLKK